MSEKTMPKLSVLSAVYIAAGAALITVCSWITIPFFTVPFTMQTFAVFLVLLLLGGRRGTLSVLLYLVMGAIGLPVFSGFAGGAGKLAGPTGGYLIGFIAAALVYWGLTSIKKGSRIMTVCAMAAGLLVCYAFGTAWFVVVYNMNTGAMSVASALSACVLPFIIPDVVKLAIAWLLAGRLRPLIKGL